METPVIVGCPPRAAPVGPVRSQKHSLPTTIELGGQFVGAESESVAVLDTGATAIFVCYEWLERRDLVLGEHGFPKAIPYLSAARFEFGVGGIGEVKNAADIKVGFAGCKDALEAFVLDAETPALLRKGALEALGDPLDFDKDTLSLLRHGVSAQRTLMPWSIILSLRPSLATGRILRPRTSSGRFWRSGQICLMEDCICHSWKAGSFVSRLLGIFRPVRK